MLKNLLILLIPLVFSGCFEPIYELFAPKSSIKHQSNQPISKPNKPNVQAPKTTLAKQQIKEQIKKPAKEQPLNKPPASKLKSHRIAFVGDSHIAADFMSQHFRKLSGIHALGFIPPALPKYHRQQLASYEVKNAEIKYLINAKELDFAGISAVCKQPCDVKVRLGFMPVAPKVIIDDSLRSLAPSKELSLHTSGRVGGFISGNSSFIDNLGINGASVFNYQRIRPNNIAQLLNYDLVIFSFGTNEAVAAKVNEAAIIANMQAIFSRFKDAQKILLLPPEPVLYQKGSYSLGASTSEVFKALSAAAKLAGARVFDVRELERSEGGREAWRKLGLAQANTHLSIKGYYYVANKLYEYLLKEGL